MASYHAKNLLDNKIGRCRKSNDAGLRCHYQFYILIQFSRLLHRTLRLSYLNGKRRIKSHGHY